MSYRRIQVAVGVVTGLMAVLVFTRYLVPDPLASAPHPNLVPAPFEPTPLELTSAEGGPWSLTSARGTVTAIFFGYTNCPDVCPLTLARLGRLQEEFEAQEREPFSLVFVSVDPVRDSAAAIERYTSRLPGQVLGVSAEDVREQAFDFGIVVRELPGPAGPDSYLVDHTARTFILHPDGRVGATLPPMVSSEEARETMEAVYARLESAR